LRSDQAEGLRRLLARDRLRVVAISASTGSRGKSGVIINLAGAMAEQGSGVLILDEAPAGQSVCTALGLDARFDLEDVIRRRRDLHEVILHGPAGILVLPLARGARSLPQLPLPDQQWLVEQCSRLGLSVDTLLLDTAPGGSSALLWPRAAAHEVVVIEDASAAAITAAYALIKRLCNEFARRDFHILVSEVSSESKARTLFDNMAQVARSHLQVSLDFMGHISPDEKLRHAARLKLPVIAAFPGTPASGSYRWLARSVTSWPRAVEDSSGFDDFMRHLIHSSRGRSTAAQISP